MLADNGLIWSVSKTGSVFRSGQCAIKHGTLISTTHHLGGGFSKTLLGLVRDGNTANVLHSIGDAPMIPIDLTHECRTSQRRNTVRTAPRILWPRRRARSIA